MITSRSNGLVFRAAKTQAITAPQSCPISNVERHPRRIDQAGHVLREVFDRIVPQARWPGRSRRTPRRSRRPGAIARGAPAAATGIATSTSALWKSRAGRAPGGHPPHRRQRESVAPFASTNSCRISSDITRAACRFALSAARGRSKHGPPLPMRPLTCGPGSPPKPIQTSVGLLFLTAYFLYIMMYICAQR